MSSYAHVVHTTAKQVISHRRKNENVSKMSKDEKCTCKAWKTIVFHRKICKFVGFLLPSSSWLLKSSLLFLSNQTIPSSFAIALWTQFRRYSFFSEKFPVEKCVPFDLSPEQPVFPYKRKAPRVRSGYEIRLILVLKHHKFKAVKR